MQIKDGSIEAALDDVAGIDKIGTFPSIEVGATLRSLGISELDRVDPRTRVRVEAGAGILATRFSSQIEQWSRAGPGRDRVPTIVATARLPEFEGPRVSAAPATYVVLMWVGKLLIAREASIADSIADSKHPPLKRVRVQSPTTYRFAKSAVSADEKRLATFVPLGVCT